MLRLHNNQNSIGLTTLSAIALFLSCTLIASDPAQAQPVYAVPPVIGLGEQIIGEIPGSARPLLETPLIHPTIPLRSGQIPVGPVTGPPAYVPGEVILPRGEIPGSIRILYDSADPRFRGVPNSQVLQAPNRSVQQPPQVILGAIANPIPEDKPMLSAPQSDEDSASGLLDELVAPGPIDELNRKSADNGEAPSSPDGDLAKDNEPTLADEATTEIISQLDDARKQITSLKDELLETRQESETATERLFAAEKAAEATQKNLQDQIAKMKLELKQNKSKQDDAQTQIAADLKEKEATLQKLLAKHRNSSNEVEAERAQLSARVDALSTKLKKSDTQRSALKDQLAQLTRSSREQAERKGKTTRKIKKLEAERKTLKKKLDQATKESREDMVALKKELSSIEKELKHSRAKVALLSRANNDALKSSAAAIAALKTEKAARMKSELKLAEIVKKEQDIEKSDAQKRLDKLNKQAELFAKDKKAAQRRRDRLAAAEKKRRAEMAEAKKAAQEKAAQEKAAQEKAAQEKVKSKDKPSIARKKRRRSAEDQIKKLRDSMKRQIKRGNEQIKSRTQEKVAGLIEDGKTENSQEVRNLTDHMKKSMKENEAKIRKRIEERIRKIQKEAGARDRS